MNEPGDEPLQTQQTMTITAQSARRAAGMFSIGNLIAIILPPLGIFWFFGSIVVYTINRHHPNERVGDYTQNAAYRFYGIAGLVVVVATFYSKSLTAWLVTWAVCAAILIPLSIYDLIKIRRETWHDMQIERETT